MLTVNEAAHSITIENPVSTIRTVADFAKTSLSIQISSGDIVSSSSFSGDLTLGANIDLSKTGLTGFTRDNSGSSNDMTESHCVFSGNFYHNGKTVTLAIGEPYGYRGEDDPDTTEIREDDLSTAGTRSEGDGKIYNHRYNGLFGILNGSTML